MATWKLLLVVLPVFLVVDLLWLGVVMKGFYSQELGDLARRGGGSLSPRWPAAIVVYLLIPAGIVYFVRPLIGSQTSLLEAVGHGALFGFVLYGVYDLTNYAILEKWSAKMTAADIAWGTTLSAAMAGLMHQLIRQLGW